ncbi:MAG: superoxide dismutase [Candidatus Moranbacteria bacterium]|nr:superoxide dismutase [Candidatus Moranbacteria bacterium]
MAYEVKKFDQLIGIEGLSDELLMNHFTLYEGYVNNSNKVAGLLFEMLSSDRAGTPEYAELKRRFGWEFNGMRLHELYFGNMSKGGAVLEEGSLKEKMTAEFGSYENWMKDFKSTGAMRGIGWVVLYYDSIGDRLFNSWISEHDGGHPAGCTPLLIMDVFEHAFMIQYGLKKADYIEAFMKNIDWKTVSGRFDVSRAK